MLALVLDSGAAAELAAPADVRDVMVGESVGLLAGTDDEPSPAVRAQAPDEEES